MKLLTPQNGTKTLNVQFTPHEIKSAHLYCKSKLLVLVCVRNQKYGKHYASLHSLQLVELTAAIKFHIEIHLHSNNPISDQICNPHKIFHIPHQKSPWRIE